MSEIKEEKIETCKHLIYVISDVYKSPPPSSRISPMTDVCDRKYREGDEITEKHVSESRQLDGRSQALLSSVSSTRQDDSHVSSVTSDSSLMKHKKEKTSTQFHTIQRSFSYPYTSPIDDHQSRETMKQKKRSANYENPKFEKAELSSRDNTHIVYVPHLPSNGLTDQELQSMIRQSLERRHQISVIDVKCSCQLDLGIIYLENKEDKDNLVNTICRTFIKPNSDRTVSFVANLELVSYVVVESKDNKDHPRTDDIRHRWAQLYNGNYPLKCERLCREFPNIFRIVTNIVEEWTTTVPVIEFKIDNQTASVYLRADCCFFEALPRSITENDLHSAIGKEIRHTNLSKKRVHISLSREDGNAVVLICDVSENWTSIILNGQEFMKKDRLTYYLRLRSVPSHISISLIETHEIFGGAVLKSTSSGEDIIVELSSKRVYGKCLEQRVLRIGDDSIDITSYSSSIKDKDDEINAFTWYETEMMAGKSNIMQFVTQSKHRIFRLKWNPQAFLEQFHRPAPADDHQGTISNRSRHLLRMTVMLNTIGIVEKGSYCVNGNEIQLKPDQLNTIVYNHQSKLQRRTTIQRVAGIDYPYRSTSVRVINEDCLVAYEELVSEGYRPLLLNMANATSPGGGYRRGDGAQEENIFRRSDYYRSLDMELDGRTPTARFHCTSNCELDRLTGRQKMYPMDEFGAIYTSGLTVFRQPEDTGYAFMKKPMFNVCAIAIAAYRNPKLHDNRFLSSRYSIGMRKKIETIFAIAKHHKHDCLILSAFGCGAFRNPPKHVARIFKSVIEQYAGFFKQISFAIIDDHNTGQDLNPHGNYLPFHEILDGLKVEPIRHQIVDTMIGPWRILNATNNKEISLSDVSICYLPPCHYGGRCRDLENKQHCREYLHPPLCSLTDSSKVCQSTNDEDHMLWFRHRIKFSNDASSHSDDMTLCPWTPFYCRQHTLLSESRDIEGLPLDIRNHCREFRHVCRFGRQCHQTSSLHLETTIHIARDMCPEGDKCSKINQENHLNSFSHPGKADIRRLCAFAGYKCRDRRKLEHLALYRHYGNYDSSSVIPYRGLNNQINFIQNQQEMITTIHHYAEILKLKTPLSIPHPILKCIQGLSPVYQCSKAIFELILVHDHVMSSERVEQLTNPHVLIQTIQKSKHIHKILSQHKKQTGEDHINNYIQAIVSAEYSRRTPQPQSKMIESRATTSTYLPTAMPEENFNDTILKEEKFLRSILTHEEIDTIRLSTIKITEASLNIPNNPVSTDQTLEKHITTVFGPHLRHKDEDIVLVFKREVMHHPDANFSIQSITSFLDGKTFLHRPWIKDPGTSRTRLKQFHKSQLHCSIQGYDYAAAAELLATIGMTKKTMDIDLKTIVTYMSTVHSDQLFEGHLPELIPLDYIEEVYIPHALFVSLTPAAHMSAKSVFHDSLHIIPREVNRYQDYVNDKLIQKLIENTERLPTLRGSIITLPSSHLKEYVILPFTLAHQSQKRDSISDDIYIYWQSMYGGMMMALSNEPIDIAKNPQSIRSLLCYIAETPSTTTSNYHESYSYLNSGDPLQHETIMDKRSFLAYSHTFHRGCNVDDYLTYCLKLEKNTGQVTLTHAGPNSIYNYETISYKFPKTNLDLNELNYIQISADSQRVPIRNFIVCFKPLADLHPSFEKNFHRTSISSSQSNAHSSDVDQKKLNPCRDSINCLRQTSDDHCKKYSHPCRYSELCRNKDNEPHLIHETHQVETCSFDKSCQFLDDPYHRAKYRHTGLPDFLIPCRDQTLCHNRSLDHRMKYSHGEKIDRITTTVVGKPRKLVYSI
jgi:uncharacterized protein (TIGR02452 family)